MVDSARNGRWAGFVGVLIIAILSWSTGRLNRRSDKTLINLGDQRLIAEGMGPTLADLIRRPPSPITNGRDLLSTAGSAHPDARTAASRVQWLIVNTGRL